MGAIIGLECHAYRNTGAYASPNWNELTNMRDGTLKLEKDKADVSSRATGKWKAKRGTLKDASIDIEIVWDTSDDDFGALLDSFLNGTQIDILVLDGPVGTTGSQGPRGYYEVMSFSRKEPLGDAVLASVTLEPTYNPVHPLVWWIV